MNRRNNTIIWRKSRKQDQTNYRTTAKNEQKKEATRYRDGLKLEISPFHLYRLAKQYRAHNTHTVLFTFRHVKMSELTGCSSGERNRRFFSLSPIEIKRRNKVAD